MTYREGVRSDLLGRSAMAAETPLVHRTVRSGAVLLVAAALQFVIVMALAANRFSGYSWTATRASALAGSGSPWAPWFDASLVAFGLLAVFALLLIWTAFDTLPTRGLGIFLLMIGAVSAIAFGLVSGVSLLASASVAHWSIYVGAFATAAGLVVLPFAMHRQDRWRASRIYTFVSGVVVFAAIALYASGTYLGLGPGGMELLGLGTALLWPIAEGAHIALLHRFAPGLHVKVAAA